MRKYTVYFMNKITLKDNNGNTTFLVDEAEFDNFTVIGTSIIELHTTQVNIPKVIIVPIHNILNISLN